jgi:hypothetical protein
MTDTDTLDLAGRRGWAVVAVLAVLLLVVPGFILVTTPRGLGSYGLYVAIAMVPALAFGAFGVWTALRHRGG